MLEVPLFVTVLLLTLFGDAWVHDRAGVVAYFAWVAAIM